MHLNPYGHDAVLLAADLANRPPTSVADLEQRCRAAGLVVEREPDDHDLAVASAVLEAWIRVVDTPHPTSRAEQVNRLLAEFCGYPRMTDHVGDGWHLHFRAHDLPVGRVLGSLLAMGTALHLCNRGMHRLGRCAALDCPRVFADVSRTGRQRYCSHTCANRDAVRRHRAGGPAPPGRRAGSTHR